MVALSSEREKLVSERLYSNAFKPLEYCNIVVFICGTCNSLLKLDLKVLIFNEIYGVFLYRLRCFQNVKGWQCKDVQGFKYYILLLQFY